MSMKSTGRMCVCVYYCRTYDKAVRGHRSKLILTFVFELIGSHARRDPSL